MSQLTHYWDSEEYGFYLKYPQMFLTIPWCASTQGETRASRCPMLVLVDNMRTVDESVTCKACTTLYLFDEDEDEWEWD